VAQARYATYSFSNPCVHGFDQLLIEKFFWLADHGRVIIALAIPAATLSLPR
jgi:hypothetical protein